MYYASLEDYIILPEFLLVALWKAEKELHGKSFHFLSCSLVVWDLNEFVSFGKSNIRPSYNLS